MGSIDWERRLAVDADASVPLYRQLRERLRAVLGGCEPGVALPTEKALMRYAGGVSRATVRRAITDLVQEGLLVSRQGSGTYTAAKRVPTELGRRPAGFTESMRRIGQRPSTQVCEAQVVSASVDDAARFGIEEGAEVVQLERLRLLDGEPCMLERAKLPAELVPGLLEHDLAGSLYEILRERYELVPASGSETIVAVNADRGLARLLDVPVAAALIVTARTTLTVYGTTLEYTTRYARGDMCAFFVELNDVKNALTADPRTARDVGEPAWF